MAKKINRRAALKTAGLAASGLALAASPLVRKAGAAEKLNFLFILSDDQRYDALSIAGHPFLKTPHLDWVAQTGTRFTNAFVTTSLCSPSRASFLTGKYAHNHGVMNNLTPWQEGNVTFLELLKKAGWYTGFIGKWHMPGKGLPDLVGQGKIDEFVSFTAVGGQGIYNNCPLVSNGKPLKIKGYITDVLDDLAVSFINRARDKNFCLYLSHKATHMPFDTPPPYKGMYQDAKLDLPPEYLARGLDLKDAYLYGPAGFSGRRMEDEMRKYFATVRALDDSLAKVFGELDRLNLLDRTVIVFCGDNGFLWGEHNLIDKRFAYEESMRIPYLVRAPGIISQPGNNIDRMILNIDLAPSFLDLAGLPAPEYMQGQSFKPLLRDSTGPWRKSFLYEYFYDPPYHVPAQLAVRTETAKYVRYKNDQLPEALYDLSSDPREQTNLAGDAGHEALKKELAGGLDQLLKQTGYPGKYQPKKP